MSQDHKLGVTSADRTTSWRNTVCILGFVAHETDIPTILVVEDDANLVELLSMHLRDAGMRVEHAASGDEGLRKAQGDGIATVILDLMLPGLDGLAVCRALRRAQNPVPILMLTARSEEMDTVLGLELGADDYMTKPFSPRELVARVKALLRRSALAESEDGTTADSIRVGDLVIDVARHRVFRSGTEIGLTAREFELLAFLARHPGQAFTREQLLDRVWDYSHGGYSHTVNSHINRLRGKIEDDPSSPRFVRTVWGFGYRFAEARELEADNS